MRIFLKIEGYGKNRGDAALLLDFINQSKGGEEGWKRKNRKMMEKSRNGKFIISRNYVDFLASDFIGIITKFIKYSN